MPTSQEIAAFFNLRIERLQNLSESQLQHDTFLLRDILLYSWLLHERDNVVRKDQLCKYVSPSGAAAIEAMMLALFEPDQIARVEERIYRFLPEALEAIPRVLDNPQHGYKFSEQVPFWDSGVTGKKVVQYFCQMDHPSQPLIDLVERAFRNLTGFQATRNGCLLHLTRGRNSAFYIYVRATDGALRFTDVDAIFGDLGVLGAVGTGANAPILVCSANPDDNATSQRLRDLPLVYGASSIELVSLFHYMNDLVNEFEPQKVSQQFMKIFPTEIRSFFSARHAAKRVRDAL
ncbi:MAG: hypothetical protein NZ571_14055 [Anaerolineae bacterium]|nr:hypothetical protein [Anaerolineae bacterium]